MPIRRERGRDGADGRVHDVVPASDDGLGWGWAWGDERLERMARGLMNLAMPTALNRAPEIQAAREGCPQQRRQRR
jgi:hypothetical protein